MKLALLLLCIATICYSIPILTPYRSVDISGANKDPIVTSLLEFGAKQLIQTGLHEQKLPHGDFRLSKVNSIHMQNANGLNYKFDVDLQDKDGLTVNSAFVMNYQPETDQKKMSSLSYSVKKSHVRPDLTKFTTLDNSELQHNPQISDVLEFGVQDLIQKGMRDQKIPLKQFRLGNLLKVQKQDLGLGSGSFYHFNLDLTDGEGTEIMAAMTLFHNPFTMEQEVIDTSYKVQPFVSHLQLSETLLDDPNDYITIEAANVSQDPEIQGALEYGVSQVINTGIQEKKLSITQLTVSSINKCQKQTTGSGVNYKFQLNLADNDKTTTVSATFTVFINNADQVRSMKSYSYQVKTTSTTTKAVEPVADAWATLSDADQSKDSNVQTCLDFGIGEVLRQAKAENKIDSEDFKISKLTSVEKQTVDSYSFYRFNAELKNKDSTLTATFTITYNLNTNKPGMKAFLYKVVTTKTTGTSTIVTDADGYAQVELMDVQTNSEIKSCLEYGVAQIIEKGLQDKKIPVSVFTLSSVSSCGKLMVGEINNYKFDVELGNGAGSTIKATFTVQYNTKSVAKSLLAFNYSAKTVTTTKATVEPDETAYVDVASTEAVANVQINGNLEFCMSEVLKNAVSQGKLTTSAGFKITKITKVQKQYVGSYLFTKLEMDLGDGATTTVNINAVVGLNTDTGERQLNFYIYNIKITKVTKTSIKEPADSAFTEVDPKTVVDSVEIQGVLDYATQQILAGALKENKIKNTDFTVDKVTVRSAAVGTATFYKFVGTLSNGKDTTMDITATILHESSGRDSVRAYNYNVKIVSSIKTVIKDPADSEYTTVDQSEVAVNSEIQAGLQFAMQQTLLDALEEGKVKSTDGFNIEKISYVGRAIVKKNTFYKFVLTIDNDEDSTVESTAVILYDTKTAKFVLRKLNYSVKVVQNIATTIEEPADEQFTLVDQDQVQNSELIQSILGVGTQQIIQAALQEGKIKDSNFKVQSVEWVKKATVKVFTFYRFSVVIDNGDDTTITATFSVVHNSRSGENSMRRYNYNVKVVVWNVSNIQEPNDDQYEAFDSSEIKSDAQVGLVFQYSVDNILSAAIKDGKISNANFKVTSISYSGRVTIRQFTFYRFIYVLDNDDDTTIEVSCTLAFDSRTNETGLRKFLYNVTITQTLINDVKEPDEGDYRELDTALVDNDQAISGIFASGIKAILDKALEEGKISNTHFNVKTVTLCMTVTVKKYVFYRFSATLDNDDDTTIGCTFTVVHSAKTDENSLRRYAYNVVITQTLITEVPEPVDTDYQDLELSQVETDEQIKTIFEFGITEILQKALDEGKITSTNFNVKNVVSVKVATVKKYTFYRFSLVLDDGDETTISCTTTVVHSGKTGENSLRRFNYKVTVVHIYVSNAEEPGDDQYGEVSVDEVKGNKDVFGGLEYAAKEVVKSALEEGKITSTNFNVKEITSCSRAVIKRFTFYRYSFVLDNGDDTTITVSVTVVHDSKTGEYGMRRFKYNVTVTITLINDVQEPTDDQYQELDVSFLQSDEEAGAVFQFGAKEIVASALQEGRIESTNFNIKTVTFVKRVTIKSFTFYRFSFSMDDGEGTTLDCMTTIVHSSKTGENSMRRFNYKVTVIKTSITDVQEPDDDEYQEVSIEEAESTKTYVDAYLFGCNGVVKKAIEEGKASSDTGLTFKTLISVKKAVVKRFTFYRFTVILDNGKGATMKASLTVIQDSKTGECSLRRYSYQITIKTVTTHTSSTQSSTTSSTTTKTIKKYTSVSIDEVKKSIKIMSIVDSSVRWICERLYKDGIIKDISFRITTIDSCFKKYENGLFYYKFSVHITHNSGLTLEISFTCSYNADTDETIVISFSITGSTQEVGKMVCIDSPEMKQAAINLIIGNIETVDTSEVEGCSDIRDAMLFGANLVGSNCAKQEGLEDADFSVSKVNSIYRVFMAGVSYRFNVDLENTSGEKVKATFTISSDHQLSTFYYVVYE